MKIPTRATQRHTFPFGKSMKKYKIKVKATICLNADGKQWEQEVVLEYESNGENPWDMYCKAYQQQKNSHMLFGEMEIIDAETNENCDYHLEWAKSE